MPCRSWSPDTCLQTSYFPNEQLYRQWLLLRCHDCQQSGPSSYGYVHDVDQQRGDGGEHYVHGLRMGLVCKRQIA